MSEFDQKIQQIQSSIETLTGSLRKVDSALKEANDRFEAMSRNAESINRVSASVARLERLVDKLDKGTFTDKLRGQVEAIAREIGKLDVGRLQTVTTAFEGQASALNELNRAQVNINQNFRRAGDIIRGLTSTLGELSNAAGSVNTNLEGSIERVNKAMQNIGDVSGKVQHTVTALNSLQSDKYIQTAEALERIATAVSQISGVNLDIGGLTSSASRVRAPRATPVGPSAAAQKFASANNIDLTQFEGKVSVQQLRQHLASQTSTTKAETSQTAATEIIQKANDRLQKLANRAKMVDEALAQVEAAEEAAFQQVAAQYGYKTSVQRDTARAGLMTRGKEKFQVAPAKREAEKTLSQFGSADAEYRTALSNTGIETSLKDFKNFAASDVRAIEGLIKLRESLAEEQRKIQTLLERYGSSGGATGATPEVNAAIFAPAGGVARGAARFSEDVYRPASYGLSQFGAALNSVIQITRGLANGGGAGGLDALGGIFKLLHTVANTNAYYGLNMLPQGVGQVFQPKRSGVLMDIAEAFVGHREGVNRTPLEFEARAMQRRADLMGSGIKTLRGLRSVETDPIKQQQLDDAIKQASEELKELRKVVKAYNDVIKREAERAAANPTPYQSTGRTVSQSVLDPMSQVDALMEGVKNAYTRSYYSSQLSDRESVITRQAQESFARFGQGTGLQNFGTGHIMLVDDNTLAKFMDQAHGQGTSKASPGRTLGVNIPAFANEDYTGASSVSVASIRAAGMAGSPAQVLVHEFTHNLVDQLSKDASGQFTGKGIYTRAGGRGYHTDRDLESMTMNRQDILSSSRKAVQDIKRLAEDLRSIDPRASNFAAAAATNKQYQGYVMRPQEQFAHMGEALLSGNQSLQQALKAVYGPELFNAIKRKLEQEMPDVFSEPALRVLQQRYQQLNKEISESIQATENGVKNEAKQKEAQPTSAAANRQPFNNPFREQMERDIEEGMKRLRQMHQQQGTGGGLQRGAQQATSFFDQIQEIIRALLENLKGAFGPLQQQLAGLMGGFRGGMAGAQVDMALGGAMGDETAQYIDKYAKLLAEFAPRNIEHLFNTLTGSRGLVGTVERVGRAAMDPTGTAKAGVSFVSNIDNIRGLANTYASKIIRDIEFPLGLVGAAIKDTGIVEAMFNKVSESVQRVALGQSNVGPLRQRLTQELLKIGVETQISPEVSFRDELNSFVRRRTGRNIEAGSFQQSATLNPMTGMTEFALSARTADGAMVSLNGHLDEFGRKKISDPSKQMSEMKRMITEFFTAIPRQLGYQLTYQMTDTVQRAFTQILGIQDELSEIASIQGAAPGDQAAAAKYDFLHRSVQTAQFTGQGFDEAVQTNLMNYKILGGITDTNQRANLSNQLSKVQLGAQTAFGISLEQSLEAIPAILASIGDGMEGVEDPVERTTLSIQQLQEVMDRMVVAQRASGASGEDMIEVFARLSSSSREYGLTSKELVNLVAASAVAIGKGPEENANVLRTLLEGTYSTENQGALRDFGIVTKSFNAKTNTIENRDFNEVMADLQRFITDPATKGQASQLFQVFGGPKLAPDIGKAIRGYNTNIGRLDQAQEQQFTGDNFDQIVARKSENLQGSLKKLGAAGTELFNTFLVGTGAMEDASRFFDRLADSAERLTEYLSSQGGTIKEVFSFITNYFKYNLIGVLSKDVNLFSPLAKGMGTVKTAVSSAVSGLIDFGKEGESSSNRVLKTFRLLGQVFNDIEASALGTSKSMQNAAAATTAAASKTTSQLNPMMVGTVGGYRQTSMFGDDPEVDMAMAMGAGQPNARSRLMGFAGRTLNRLSTISPTFGGLSTFWSNNQSRLRNAAMTVGDVGGSMLAPAGFDLITGGLGKSNLINTAGATLAGTFLGAVTASPQLGLVGYGMAKSFMENIDFSKFFGASDTEVSNFGKAIAEAIRQANLTPEQQEVEQQQTQAAVAQENAIGKLARENFGRIDQGLGLSQFDQRMTEFINSQTMLNRGILKLPGMGISSAEIEQYQRLIVQGERPRGYGDERFVRSKDDILASGRFQAIEQVYAALGNDQLRNAYIQSNVTDPTKFLNLFADLQEGKGELLKNEDIRSILQAIQRNEVPTADTGQIEAAGGEVTASLETSNDIIKRINGSLSEFSANAEKMSQMDTGLLEYGEFGTQLQKIDAMFADKFAGIRSGAIQGPEAQRIMEQYDKSRQSALAIPGSLQNLLPLAQSLGLNTKGLEQNLYGMGAEGQQQLQQRFAQAQQSNRFVQDYENRMRALKQYEATDQYKARNADVLREHEALKKTLETDKARYNVNLQYLELLKSQTNILNDQTGAIKSQNQTRQLISAGTPATFSPASIFNTAGYSASQINKAIESALQKQGELEKMSPGYRKYFAEQQFLLQGRGGFKGVTGVDQGFLQEALAAQQSRMTPPQLEDLSQYSDAQLEKILSIARDLQGQAVALNPDLAGQYEDERIMIYRKNNQLLQETGLSQEYLRLALQENTKSNETLRGHYNLPSAYRAPTVWDYYNEGGKETGDVNFPNKGAQGTMVPLSFAQKLAEEMMKGPVGDTEGADLGAITNTVGPGSSGQLQFYSGGSPAIYSDVVDLQADVLNLEGGLLGQNGGGGGGGTSDVDEIRRMAAERRAEEREKGRTAYQNKLAYDAQRAEERAGGRPPSAPTAPPIPPGMVDPRHQAYGGYEYEPLYTPAPAAPAGGWWAGATGGSDAGGKTADLGREAGKAKDRLSDLAQTTPNAGKAMTSLAGASQTAVAGMKGVASLGTAASSFTGAVTALVTKVQSFDLARTLQNSKITLNVTINGQTVPASQAQVQINNTSGGGGSGLTGQPTARTRIS